MTAANDTSLRPIVSIDVQQYGIPRGFFDEHEHCRHAYNSLRSLRWPDSSHLIFAFSTNPECSDSTGPVDAAIRVLRFDIAGGLVASIDVPFDAGTGGAVQLSNSIDLCPGGSVVIHTISEKNGTNLTILSPELKVLKAVPLSFGNMFWGTTFEHGWVVISNKGDDQRQKYTFYSIPEFQPLGSFLVDRNEWPPEVGEYQVVVAGLDGVHLRRQDGTSWFYKPASGEYAHFEAWLSDQALLFQIQDRKYKGSLWSIFDRDGHRTDLPRLPSPYSEGVVFGFSADNRRFAIGGYSENYSCEGAKELISWLPCRVRRRLFLLDQSSERIIFQRALPGPATAALSPDGAHLAVLDRGKIDIYVFPR